MHSDNTRARIRLFCVAALAAAGFVFGPTPVAHAGAADNVWGWLWSSTGGWISMNCIDLGSCATVDYGVRLEDVSGSPGVADLKGYAWSETLGWICFGTTCAGTTPEGGASFARYRTLFEGKADRFWGWAKVISLGNDGWISLNCDKETGVDECGTSSYYVGFDMLTGVFNAGGATNHWAWSGNDVGTGLGWVDTSQANTSWVFATLGKVVRPSGVFEPESLGGVCATDAQCVVSPHLSCNTGIGRCVLPGTHRSTFEIGFLDLSASNGNYLECEITLPNLAKHVASKTLSYVTPPGRVVGYDAETLTFTVLPGHDIQPNSVWYLSVCRLAGTTNATNCTADAQCAADQAIAICDETAGKCRSTLASTIRAKPIYAHGNEWTGLGAAEDQFQAIKCSAGFPDNYFGNSAVCDFTADASFALSMRRGIPVEGDCDDGVDNDGNGQIDCSDRYCKGISYVCAGTTLPRASCTWGMSGDNINDCSDPGYVYGNLCCTRQPVSPGAGLSQITDGLECVAGDPNDGMFDCSCTNQAAYDVDPSDDCFSPGFQSGDICCSASGDPVKP